MGNDNSSDELVSLRARVAQLELVELARRQAEAALLDSQVKYRTLADNSSDIIIRFDYEGRHMYVNAAVSEIAGIPPEQALGKTHAELGYPESVVELVHNNIRKVFETKLPLRVASELTTLKGNRFFDSLLVPEFDPDGAVASVLTTTRDITDLRAAQQALIDANQSLEQRVNERTAELKKTNEQLENEIAIRRQAQADLQKLNAELEKRVDEISRLREQLELENEYLREEVEIEIRSGNIVGKSSALMKVLSQIEMVAPTDANVLILGESGTGKEMVARAIHERSRRKNRPLVRVNCGAIPRELFESEFFGHVRGSFTGAVKDRVGRFQLADGGTLFLDEVAEIPVELQSKLLRVLQEGQFERIGEEKTITVNVRIIAATNRDLELETKTGRFREDLFYRLSVFPITTPPLRDRLDDIPALAAYFVNKSSNKVSGPMVKLTQKQIRLLQNYAWPGNIRELQNVIERAVILSRGASLNLEQALPSVFPDFPNNVNSISSPLVSDEVLTELEMRRVEKENILRALQKAGGKLYGSGGAAEILGVSPTTLASRMKKMGIARAE